MFMWAATTRAFVTLKWTENSHVFQKGGTVIHPQNRQHVPAGTGERRRNLRYMAAIATSVTAIIYFLIGLNVLRVIDTAADQIFGIFAGIAYACGTLLLIRFDRQSVWLLGAAFQVFVIFTYFDMAAERSPSYEFWGIMLRIIQLVLLMVLVSLIWHARSEATGSFPRTEGKEDPHV